MNLEAKPPPPSSNCDHTKMSARITTKTNLECHLKSITILDEFSFSLLLRLYLNWIQITRPYIETYRLGFIMYPTKTNQGIPTPLGMEPKTTSALNSKIHLANQILKTKINISTPWNWEKGNTSLKSIVITQQNNANENKRRIYERVNRCLYKPARKSLAKC